MTNLSKLAVAVASAFFITPVFSNTVISDHASEPASNMEKISVHAKRYAKPIQQTLNSVTILTRADIERYQPADLPALLQLLPGVSIARSGSRGQVSSVFIRGGKSGHSLILWDGVRIGSATLGYQDISHLPLDMIEKVEFIRGPASTMYGSDALGGVIAITTRQGQQQQLQVRTGSAGLVETGLHLNHVTDGTRVSFNTGFARADGIHVLENADPDRDGFRQRHARLVLAQQTDVGLFQLQSALNRGFSQYDNTWPGDEAKNTTDSHQFLWDLTRSYQGTFETSHRIRASQSKDQLLTLADGQALSLYQTDRQEVDAQTVLHLSEQLNVLVGANSLRDKVSADSVIYSLEKLRTNSVFAAADYQLQDWLLEGSLRRDWVSQHSARTNYQWALGYYVLPQLQLRYQQGTAFKVPTFNDLYWPQYGNPALQPEESLSREIGLRFEQGFTVDLVHFERDLTRMILNTRPLQNIELASVRGFEYSFATENDNISQQLDITYTVGEDLRTGLPLVRIPKTKASYVFSQTLKEQWQWTAQLQYMSRIYNGVNWQQIPQPEIASTVLFGAGVSYQWSEQMQLRLKLDNVLNRTYQTNLGYLQPGREWSLSWKYLNF